MTNRHLTPIARRLRGASTDAEQRLWFRLRNRQLLDFKFRRQCPIGSHVADFVCDQVKLVIELDGGQHADSATDPARTAAIEAAGYQILRFWNHDVLTNTDGVLEVIAQSLREATNA